MNALHPLAVYAAVQAQKGEKLEYPGDYDAWLGVCEHSTSKVRPPVVCDKDADHLAPLRQALPC